MKKPKRVQNRSLLNEVKQRRCLVCGGYSDPCHVRSRGAGGDDVVDNLLPLCRSHHTEQHKRGWVGFCEKYPSVELHLNDLGWMLETLFGRTRLVKNEST